MRDVATACTNLEIAGRDRRTCLGELIQIDGCDHEWFEGRAERCTLLVFVDDATSSLQQLYFCDGESPFNYFEAGSACASCTAMRASLAPHSARPRGLARARERVRAFISRAAPRPRRKHLSRGGAAS